MDINSLRTIYPSYTDEQLAEVEAIYSEAEALRSRIAAMPAGFARTTAQASLSQTLLMLANNVPAK